MSPGVRDLHRYTRPQEHHRVQPVCEAGAERSSSVMGVHLHRRVRPDVACRHRYRHQRGGGWADSRSADPGRPGGARRRDVCLHHLPGDPPTWAQLTWEAAPQGALHPAGLQRHGRSDVFGLSPGVVSVGTFGRRWCGGSAPTTAAPISLWMTFVQRETLSSSEEEEQVHCRTVASNMTSRVFNVKGRQQMLMFYCYPYSFNMCIYNFFLAGFYVKRKHFCVTSPCVLVYHCCCFQTCFGPANNHSLWPLTLLRNPLETKGCCILCVFHTLTINHASILVPPDLYGLHFILNKFKREASFFQKSSLCLHVSFLLFLVSFFSTGSAEWSAFVFNGVSDTGLCDKYWRFSAML